MGYREFISINRKKIAIKVAFIIFLSLILVISLFAPTRHTPPIPDKIMLGAWTQGFFDPDTQQVHPEKLHAFEDMIHKHVAIAHFYTGWGELDDPNLVSQIEQININGWEPMLNVNPYYFSGCPASSSPLYRAISQGKCDSFLRKAGKNLAKIQKPFFFVFAWEMNNPHNFWEVTQSGSTPQDFIAAWRHIHTIFQEEGVTNAVWVFCPNVPDDPDVPYNKIYPGDKYVDWVALDGYNWGTTQSWSEWVSFSGVFTGAYDKITKIAPDKPVMIAEVNTTDQGGNKPEWYRQMFRDIPLKFPKIKAVVIFNEDKSKQEQVNWRVDISKNSLEAFTQAIHSKYY